MKHALQIRLDTKEYKWLLKESNRTGKSIAALAEESILSKPKFEVDKELKKKRGAMITRNKTKLMLL